jgi:hypothetical protein
MLPGEVVLEATGRTQKSERDNVARNDNGIDNGIDDVNNGDRNDNAERHRRDDDDEEVVPDVADVDRPRLDVG